MQKLCKIILDYFSDSSITPSQYNIYLYGLKCLMNELVANILLFSFAFLFDTVEHVHHPLSPLQQQQLKKRSILIWFILFTLFIIFYKYPTISSSITTGMFEAISLSLIALLINRIYTLNTK